MGNNEAALEAVERHNAHSQFLIPGDAKQFRRRSGVLAGLLQFICGRS
jgi:hypothetical protein